MHSSNMKKNFRTALLLVFIALLLPSALFAITDAIVPGGDWRDTDGNLIHATEGGFITVNDTIFMWGMDRAANNHTFEAINLYASTDFKNWIFINKILTKSSHKDIDNGAVVERAKILHNEKTGKFIIWMHFEGHDAYSVAEVAYATCSTIGGDYTFHEHFRPKSLDSRDLNVYKDDDGKAYLICTTKGNQNVSLFELDENYTGIVREVYRGNASDDMECEGHGIIKKGGYYFWLMSWCSGWDFNENHYYYSKTLAGPWAKGGNIAVTNTHTYESQVGFSYTHTGTDATTFVYLGDRWSVRNFSMSRLIVLPIEVSGTTLKVPWHDQWDLNTRTGTWHPGARNFIDGEYTITAKHSGMALSASSSSSGIQQQKLTGSEEQLWRIENRGASHFRITSVASGKSFDVSDESRDAGAKVLQWEWKDSYNQKWHIIDCGDGYHRFISVNTLGKTLEIENGSESAGANTVIGDFSYKDYQMFRITAVRKDIASGQKYCIINKASGKSLAIAQGSSGELQLEGPGNQSYQVWKIDDLFNSYCSFTNAGTETALDNQSSLENSAAVSHKTPTEVFSQQWQPVSAGSGYYTIYNRKSGKVLEDKGGNGISLVQSETDENGNSAQLWRFEKVDAVSAGSAFGVKTPISGHQEFKQHFLYNIRGQKVHRGAEPFSSVQIPAGVYFTQGKITQTHIKCGK